MQGANKKICIHDDICIEWSIYFIALKLSVVDGLVVVVMVVGVVVETMVVVEVVSVDPATCYVRMLKSFKVKGWLSVCTILFILYSTEAHEVEKNNIPFFLMQFCIGYFIPQLLIL